MYTTVPRSEIDRRIGKIRELMSARGVDLSLIIYNPDLFYFTGIVQQGVLVIDVENDPVFYVRRSYDRAVEESPLDNITRIDSLSDMVPFLASRLTAVTVVGLEMDVMPVNFYRRILPFFAGKECVDVSPLVRQVRSIKSGFEIDLMRRSGKKLVGLIRKAGEFIKEGKKEMDVVADMIKFSLEKGHGGSIRMRHWNQDLPFGHVLSGKSACVETYTDTPLGGKGRHPSSPIGPGENVIGAGEPIIVDMMWVEEGYITDMTRVYSLGEIKDIDINRAHTVSKEILRVVEGMFEDRKSSREILEGSRGIAMDNGLEDIFMGLPGNRVRFLGHGIGIEADEFPIFSDGFDSVLEPGMTVAIEPKFILSGKGAVGVENTYLITPDGYENLTEMDEDIIVL